jgi:hypothetical protein
MMATFMLTEILGRVNELLEKRDKKTAKQFLINNAKPTVKLLLKYLLDKNVKFYRTECPKFTPDDSLREAPISILEQELKRFYIFDANYTNCTVQRKDQLLVQILEMLNQEEAELVCNLLQRKNPYKKITKNFVLEVFPEMKEN